MKWVRVASLAIGVSLGFGTFGGAIVGCSSSATTSVPDQHAAAVVGPQGGSVSTPSGAGVSIPAGALPANVNITVDQTPDAPAPSGGRTVGTPYTFGPEGTQFSVPVTVTLDFDPTQIPSGKSASDIVIYTAPAGTTSYTPLQTALVDATHAAAQTSHFSVFVCVVPSNPPVFLDAGAGTPDAGAPDAGPPVVLDSGPPPGDDATAPLDAATVPDATTEPTDATVGGDDGGIAPGDGGGGPIDATTGGGGGGADATVAPEDASANACDPSTRWPAMLAANLVPPNQYAGVDWQGGNLTIDEAESINCAGAPTAPSTFTSAAALAWGNNGNVVVEYDPASRLPLLITLNGGYTGTMTFFSRKGSSFGNHTYVAGIGTLTRDGAAVDLWGDDASTSDAQVSELMDAFLATFDPSAPAVTDCQASSQCLLNANDGSGNAWIGFRGGPPNDFYFGMAAGSSSPTVMYTFFRTSIPDSGAPAADSGTAAPSDGGSAPTDGGPSGSVDASVPASDACAPPVCPPNFCGSFGNSCGSINCSSPSCGGAEDGGPAPSDAGVGGADASACVPPQQACASECGVSVSNGCGGSYECAPCGGAPDAGAAADGGSGGGAADSGVGCTPVPLATACETQCQIGSNGCGGFYNCPPCGDGGALEDGGKCTPMSPAEVCGAKCGALMPDGCGSTLTCPACPSEDAGAPSADACAPIPPSKACASQCGGTAPDGCGGAEPCPPCAPDAGAASGDAGSGGCSTTFLSSPIAPLQQVAGWNVNQGGTQVVPFAYAMSTDCGGAPVAVSTGDTGVNAFAWGPNDDVYAEFSQTASQDMTFFELTGSYSGTVAFNSRKGGAFGSHTYSIGLHQILRDGAPFAIDWTSTSTADTAINELYDGMVATFAPSFPAAADCAASATCLIQINDGDNPDGGIGDNLFGIRPLKLYFQVTVGTASDVNLVYGFLASPAGGTQDGGAIPGTAGNGGVAPIPAACGVNGGLGGSCETPANVLCSNLAGDAVSSCQDFPESGYLATCCPPN